MSSSIFTVCILGSDTLAAAIRECCAPLFYISSAPHGDCDVVWIAFDTPIGPGDAPDVEYILRETRIAISAGGSNPLYLISSQVPIGTTARLEKEFPGYAFAYSPENIRVATAVADFKKQERIVVGVRRSSERPVCRSLLSPFTENIIFTTVETAEMTKHALNCWLGMNIAFINEFSRLVEAGYPSVIMSDLTAALKSEGRIGPRAPLKAGGPYGLGHIARDIFVVSELARNHEVKMPIVQHIKASNDLQPEPPLKLAA